MQLPLSSDLSFQAIPILLAAFFLSVSLVTGLVVALIHEPYPHAVKLLGSLMVVGLSLLANSAFVYVVSIFIIATLVTDLEFLEKFAAIVWNRKEYWKYLIQRATPKEVEEKRKADAIEVEAQLPQEKGPADTQDAILKQPAAISGQKELIAFAKDFEEKVLEAINTGASPFKGTSIEPAVSVQSVQGNRRSAPKIVDAIVRQGSTHFVIEVKAYQRQPTNFGELASRVKTLSDFYRAAMLDRGEKVRITPVLVVPSNIQVDTLRDGIVVLRFDQERGIFINADDAMLYLESIAS